MNSRDPLLYIAGPYRCGHGRSVRENTAIANAVGRYFAAQGYHVVVPHNASEQLDPFNRLGDDYWLAATANMLRGCTHIVLGPNWHESAGAVAEYELARSLGLTVWRVEEVPDEPHH